MVSMQRYNIRRSAQYRNNTPSQAVRMDISPIVRRNDPLPISNSQGRLMSKPANPGPKRMYMDRILGRHSSLPTMNLGKQPSQRN